MNLDPTMGSAGAPQQVQDQPWMNQFAPQPFGQQMPMGGPIMGANASPWGQGFDQLMQGQWGLPQPAPPPVPYGGDVQMPMPAEPPVSGFAAPGPQIPDVQPAPGRRSNAGNRNRSPLAQGAPLIPGGPMGLPASNPMAGQMNALLTQQLQQPTTFEASPPPPPEMGAGQQFANAGFSPGSEMVNALASPPPAPPSINPAQGIPQLPDLNMLAKQAQAMTQPTPLPGGVQGLPAMNPMAQQMNALLAQQLMPSGASRLPSSNPIAQQMNALLGPLLQGWR